MLFPARESRETLDRIREEIGPYAFSAQYQQDPVPPGGNRIDLVWFGNYDETRARNTMQMVIQSWDTAVTTEPNSSFSVGLTWGVPRRQLVSARSRTHQAELPGSEIQDPGPPAAMARRSGHHRGLLCRQALLTELRRVDVRSVYVGYRPRVDKETRMAAGCGKLATGMFHLPASADWLPAFRHELMAFPNGRHDDQVDALSQFLDWIGMRPGRGWAGRQLNGGVRPRRNIRRRPGWGVGRWQGYGSPGPSLPSRVRRPRRLCGVGGKSRIPPLGTGLPQQSKQE